jgi:hypothetical protein
MNNYYIDQVLPGVRETGDMGDKHFSHSVSIADRAGEDNSTELQDLGRDGSTARSNQLDLFMKRSSGRA